MADVLNNDLIDRMAYYALGKSPPSPSLRCILYVNNYTPTVSSIQASFTKCTAPGYADVSLAGGNWTGSTTAGVATYVYPTITFTFSGNGGGQIIYGYAIFDDTQGTVLWAGTLGTSYAIPSGGGALLLNLTWVDEEC